MTVEQVRRDRELAERLAEARAAQLPAGEYYADDNTVRDHATRSVVMTVETHWDACLVMMAANRRSR